MKNFIKEFKEFAMRGNAIELAIGVVLGSSFGAIVNSLVADIITPLISLLTAGADFTTLAITLKDGPEPLLLTYGNFIQAGFTFILTSLAIFSMIKVMNRLAKKPEEIEEEEEATPEDIVLLQAILTELKAQKKQ